MNFKFTVPGRLPSMNEIVAAASYNRFAYGKLKRDATKQCADAVVADRVPVFEKPVSISIEYFEPTARRDLDGVYAGGMKFILDGLGPAKHGGVERIKNDTRYWVREIKNSSPSIDKKNPRIEVTITEI